VFCLLLKLLLWSTKGDSILFRVLMIDATSFYSSFLMFRSLIAEVQES